MLKGVWFIHAGKVTSTLLSSSGDNGSSLHIATKEDPN